MYQTIVDITIMFGEFSYNIVTELQFKESGIVIYNIKSRCSNPIWQYIRIIDSFIAHFGAIVKQS
jgi:hypothetical protein